MPADADDVERYNEAQGALLGALSGLGVDTNFWDGNEPREDDLVDTRELYERLKELPQFNEAQFASALREWIQPGPKENLTQHILVRGGMAHEIFRGKETTPGVEAVRELIKREGTSGIRTLLAMADDRLQKGLQEEALRLYGMAVADCPRPRLQMELGYKLARRAGIDPLPLIDDDFEWTGPWFSLVMVNGGSRTHMVSPTSSEIATLGLVDVAISDEVRTLFIRLALEAYGRSYGRCLTELSPSLGAIVENESVVDFTIDFWRLCALDGLRVILTGARHFEEADYAGQAELAWYRIFDEATGFMQGEGFASELSESIGYIRGRYIEAALQAAIEAARRTVVVSDPEAFASQIAEVVVDGLMKRLGSVPAPSRVDIETTLISSLGKGWQSLPHSAQQFLVEGEWLKQTMEGANGTDYGPAVLQYARAVEAYLRRLDQSRDLLSRFRERLLSGDITRLAFIKRGAPVSSLGAKIDEIAKARDEAAHGDPRPYQPTTHGRMMEIRALVLGSSNNQGLLAALLEYRAH